MIFVDPVPFSEAQQALEVKSILATDMTSAQLEKISADILERALFSARVTYAKYLQEIADVVRQFIDGEIDLATARLRLKDKLNELGYEAALDDAGGLKDFGSDERINLVIRMNARMAQGYGQWLQSQRTLDSRPAQELYRAFQRKVHRNWLQRWGQAGGKVFIGRLIALKNDPIWTAISRFGQPYPPFDYNSGMSVRSVDRKTAMAAGLIDLNTQIAPQDRGFNQDLKVTIDIRDAALRRDLEEDGYQFKTASDGTEVLTL